MTSEPHRSFSVWIGLAATCFAVLVVFISCGPGTQLPRMPGLVTGANCLSSLGTNSEWSVETLVQLDGYTSSAKQPKISSDDQVLYFRDQPATDSSEMQIYYAQLQGNGHYLYTDALFGAVDPTHMDLSPAIDSSNNFYFVSDRSLASSNQSIFSGAIGILSGTTLQLTSLASADVAVAPSSSLIMNTDIDVTWDGAQAIVTQSTRGSNTYPESMRLVLYDVASRTLATNATSSATLSAVNVSGCYTYTGTLSQDKLELYYTVYPYAGTSLSEARIAVSKRATTSDPFGAGSAISAISTSFMPEAPSISLDGKTLYYHRFDSSTGRFQIYKVTRP